jgi:hypothetical protein
MAKKATKAEVKQRTSQIIKMMTLGVSRADICQFASDNWQIDDRTTDRYIKRANDYFAETSVIDRDEQIGIAMRRYNDLYQKNMRIDDYKAALATQKELSNLLGLNAPKRTEHTGADGGAMEFKLVYPDDK